MSQGRNLGNRAGRLDGSTATIDGVSGVSVGAEQTRKGGGAPKAPAWRS